MFLWWLIMWSIFSCAGWSSACPLWKKMCIHVFCPFFFFDQVVCFLMLSCKSYLYILNINPLLVISFANIFSHSVDFFVLSMVSFTVQKLLSLVRSHQFNFAFFSFALGVWSKKLLLQFISKSVLPVFFFSRSFMVSGLIFRSLIHF